MAKLFGLVIAFVLFAACAAEPARLRSFRNNRFLARQEVASDDAAPAKAPYPPAGLKPDIPFELPTETTTVQPQPDNTYLPPETQPDNTYLPPESVPDSSYGPPTSVNDPPSTTALPEIETETEEPDYVIAEEEDDDTESVISIAVSYDNDNSVDPLPQDPQRIVYARRVQSLKGSSGKLRALKAQPILLADGSFVYSARLQNF